MEILLDVYYCSCLKTVKLKLFCLFFSPKSFLHRARLARYWVPNEYDTNTGAGLASVSAWEVGANWSKCCCKFYPGNSHTK